MGKAQNRTRRSASWMRFWTLNMFPSSQKHFVEPN
jgi:hypothetical protein